MKHLTLIIALLWALSVSGQIYIDSYRFGAPAAGLLLDDYPNAAAAYSLRLLRTAYTGNCVEVRRSSDNTTSNIGFSGGVIDTATLKTFCAGTNCFVRTWYDQSGNGYNATQTTNASQPQIVAGGALYYENGKPAINCNATSWTLDSAVNSLSLSSFSFFLALKTNPNPASILAAISFSGGQNFAFFPNIIQTTIGARVFWNITNGTTQESPSVSISNINVLYSFNYSLSNAQYSVHRNANLVFNKTGLGTPTTPQTLASLGFAPGVGSYTGRFQEVILYASDKTSDRTGIESNINSFYTIY